MRTEAYSLSFAFLLLSCLAHPSLLPPEHRLFWKHMSGCFTNNVDLRGRSLEFWLEPLGGPHAFPESLPATHQFLQPLKDPGTI